MAGSTMAAEIKKMQAPTTIMICLTMPSSPVFILTYICKLATITTMPAIA